MAVFNNQFSEFFKIQELAPKQGPWELKLPRASGSPFPSAPCPPGSLKSPPPAHSMSISLGLRPASPLQGWFRPLHYLSPNATGCPSLPGSPGGPSKIPSWSVKEHL